jgi:protein involved in polysaccharide export with SLBB domain
MTGAMNTNPAREDPDARPRAAPGPRARLGVLALGLLAAAGCASGTPQVDRSLMAQRVPLDQTAAVADRYAIACPDVLAIEVASRPDLWGQYAVGADGRIYLGRAGTLRVEGHTPLEVEALLAERLELPRGHVAVRVAQYRSASIYLVGEVNGLQRAVEYRGQETVLDLLQRVGGITPGAAPDEVYVVRSRIAEGQRPEVFHVDLSAIVMRQDHRTNLRLEPFDQVHVGATRRARLLKCLPPWLRPFFRRLCHGLPTPPGEGAAAER